MISTEWDSFVSKSFKYLFKFYTKNSIFMSIHYTPLVLVNNLFQLSKIV